MQTWAFRERGSKLERHIATSVTGISVLGINGVTASQVGGARGQEISLVVLESSTRQPGANGMKNSTLGLGLLQLLFLTSDNCRCVHQYQTKRSHNLYSCHTHTLHNYRLIHILRTYLNANIFSSILSYLLIWMIAFG